MSEQWLDELAALIDKAEAAGLWLHCRYQNMWFAPHELRAQNAEGRLQFSVENWTLRDPREGLEQCEAEAKRATDAVAAFRRRMTERDT